MRRAPFGHDPGAPPRFEEARNLRQRVRAAGMDPNHWYVVARTKGFAPGDVREVKFWGRSVALFRTKAGDYGAVENRCAHRLLALSKGCVDGAHLVCPYHGWAYDRDGRVCKIPHETFGHERLDFRVESFAVRERYGLLWVFFGDPARAEDVPLPSIPELDGPKPWPHSMLEYKLEAHHSMVMDNVSDYTHEYLHRATKPFEDPKLLDVTTEGDKVFVRYGVKIGAGRAMELFVRREDFVTRSIELVYDYPYNRSNADDYVKHFIAVLPEDERTTRAFILVYYRGFRVPFTRRWMPDRVAQAMVSIATPLVVRKVFDEDEDAVRLEQIAWEANWDAPIAELNPQVRAFQELTVRKWAEYLASTKVRAVRTEAAS